MLVEWLYKLPGTPMEICYPSRVLIQQHDGKTIEARCLTCANRKKFLELRDEAWEMLRQDDLAQAASDATHGLAHLFDHNEVFRWLCYEMLSLHKLDGRQLDIAQIMQLLFRSEAGDGALVRLQFPPMPPSSETVESDSDPYYRLLATLAYSTGDWYTAQQALETLRYDEVVSLSTEIAKVAAERKKATDKATSAPPPPRPSTDTSAATVSPTMDPRIEALRQKVKATYGEGAKAAHQQAALSALKKAVAERSQGADEKSSD